MSVASPAVDLAAEADDDNSDASASSSSSWFQPSRQRHSTVITGGTSNVAKSPPSKVANPGNSGGGSGSGVGGSLSFGAREWLARFSPLPPTPPQLTARALAASQQDHHRSPSVASSPPPPRSQPTRRRGGGNGGIGANSAHNSSTANLEEEEEEALEGMAPQLLPPLVAMSEVEVADWLMSDSRLQLLAPSLEGVDGATLAEATVAELQVNTRK